MGSVTMQSLRAGSMKRGIQSTIGLLGIYLVFCLLSPTFRTGTTFLTILTQSTILGSMAAGTTIVIIAGGLDLSIGSMIAVVAVVTGSMLSTGVPVLIVLVVNLLLGALMGTINGAIIQYTGIPAFIGTLGMMKTYRGIAEILGAGKDMSAFPASFATIGGGYVVPVLIMALCFVFVYIILSKTKLGFDCYAIGGNQEVARLAGVKIKANNIVYYALGGLFTAVAAIIQTSRLNFAQSSWGNGMELNAIAAVIIGGTSMSGGLGGVGRTVLGVLIINTLNAGLSHCGVGSSWQRICIGIVIILAVWLDTVQRKSKKG